MHDISDIDLDSCTISCQPCEPVKVDDSLPEDLPDNIPEGATDEVVDSATATYAAGSKEHALRNNVVDQVSPEFVPVKSRSSVMVEPSKPYLCKCCAEV